METVNYQRIIKKIMIANIFECHVEKHAISCWRYAAECGNTRETIIQHSLFFAAFLLISAHWRFGPGARELHMFLTCAYITVFIFTNCLRVLTLLFCAKCAKVFFRCCLLYCDSYILFINLY